MSNSKQFSFDYFHDRVMEMFSRLRPMTSNDVAQVWLDVKELHKEEIKNAYNAGYREGEHDGVALSGNENDISNYDNAEQYYNETFKNNEQQ